MDASTHEWSYFCVQEVVSSKSTTLLIAKKKKVHWDGISEFHQYCMHCTEQTKTAHTYINKQSINETAEGEKDSTTWGHKEIVGWFLIEWQHLSMGFIYLVIYLRLSRCGQIIFSKILTKIVEEC